MRAPAKIRAMVVDDEALARQILREFLAARPEIEVVAECANGFEAVKAAAELAPDLMFLDIQMPKLDGFEVLELIGDAARPAVVFATAFDTHAIRAFEVHAVDYLLKPFSAERFRTALERALERTRAAAPAAAELSASARPAPYLERVVARDGARIAIIPVAKLDYVQSRDDYIELASEGQRHLKQQTIASLERGLDPQQFARVHRGVIVNLERVARLEPAGRDSHIAVLRSGERLPVSRSGYARLRELGIL